MEAKPKTTQLSLPDWTTTRSIYKKLSDEFHVLTEAYSVSLDERTKLFLDHLILAIDEVDQAVDEIETKVNRDDITNSILKYLSNQEFTWNHKLASPILATKIQILKSIVLELKVSARFHKAVVNIFHFTEVKRHTTDPKELIELVRKEGQATAELPLSIMQIEPTHAFGLFFQHLCMLMGIADLVIDAKSDFRANYISIKPKFSLYVKLIYLVIKDGCTLIWRFPNKLKFLLYCISFSFALLRSTD